MKKIKIIFILIFGLLIAGCGYNLANKPVPTSKYREYPKKVDYSAMQYNEKNNS